MDLTFIPLYYVKWKYDLLFLLVIFSDLTNTQVSVKVVAPDQVNIFFLPSCNYTDESSAYSQHRMLKYRYENDELL